MKYLQRYENHEDIKSICIKYDIHSYTINADGTIDVADDVLLDRRYLNKLPLNFGHANGTFTCRFNNLTSLKGCPKSVRCDFSCSDNKLTTLEDCPKSTADFYCNSNHIDTFEGLDFIHIRGYFYCSGNPIWYIWNLFRDHTKFEFFNDCDIIRENRVIILDRLNFFLDYIGKETVTEVEGYKCI
jgi:hypothetical protein